MKGEFLPMGETKWIPVEFEVVSERRGIHVTNKISRIVTLDAPIRYVLGGFGILRYDGMEIYIWG